MTSGPVPTTLVLLTDLPSIPPGSKVRFLGCVTKYCTLTGTLNLQHVYPPSASHTGPAREVIAAVDVNLLLSNIKATDTQIGEWVNVIGYVDPSNRERTQKGSRLKDMRSSNVTRVQAMMMWSAGAIKIEEYERAVMGRKTASE